MGKLGTKYKVGSILVAILSILGFIVCIVRFTKGPIISMITYIVMYIFIFIYAFWGYKKPHGNMLRNLFFVYAVSIAIGLISTVQYGVALYGVLDGICIALIAYVSGRLHKIKENRIIMICVFIILCGGYIHALTSMTLEPLGILVLISPVIMWIDLCTAYFLRFKQHKFAGLMENPIYKDPEQF